MSRHLGTVVFGAIVLVLIGTAVVIINVGPRAPVPKVDPVVALLQARPAVSEDAADLYAEAGAVLTGTEPRDALEGWKPGQPLPEEVVAWVRANESARELSEQASRLEACHLPLERGESGFPAHPQHERFKLLARLHSYRARLADQEREREVLTEAVLTLDRMSRHAAQTPTLISQLTGISVSAMAVDAVLRPLTWDTLSAAERAEYAERVSPCFEPPSSLASAIQCDREEMIWMFANMTSGRKGAVRWLVPAGRYAGEVARNLAPAIALADEPVEALLDPDHPLRVQLRANEKDQPTVWNVARSLAAMLNPSIAHVLVLRGRFITEQRGNQAVLAVFLHRDRTGAFPDSLVELDPPPPVDPFSGQPFVYRREGDGFILYSVGHDREDDGGRHARRFGAESTTVRGEKLPADGDFVFWPLSARLEAEGE